ncbi:MAG: response regulator transcription factor [Chloroflexi bacterium]|nr:response regulator transcription factor [Chloroflexota bacterium]
MTRVLIVDDELAILDMLIAVFEDEGFTVVAAANGRQAIELFRQEQPDLVLLDIMMPGADGREVCRQLRDLPGGDRAAIVVMSAANRADLANCPASAFLPKPFDLDQLLALVDSILNRKALDCP